MKKNYFPLFFLGFYLLWTIRATLFYSIVDAVIASEALRLAFSSLIKFILWITPAAGFILWFDKQNPLEQMKVNTILKWNNLILVIIVSLLYFISVFTFEYLTSNRTLLPLIQAPLSKILNMLVTVSFSAVIEEIFFRGFVLHQLEIRATFWKANIGQAFLFTSIHWPYWLWTKGLQMQLVVTSIGIFILAVLLGWVLKKSNSIWPPAIVHSINNVLSAFLG